MLDVKAPSQLDDLLERRRKACAEYESQPAATTADAFSSPVSHGGSNHQTHHLRDLQLGDLLEERRKKCQVLESSPVPGSADVGWNKDAPQEVQTQCLESMPAQHFADAKCDDPMDSRHRGHLPQRIVHKTASGKSPSSRTTLPSGAVPPASVSETVVSYLQHLPNLQTEMGLEFVEQHLGYLRFEEEHLLAVLWMFLRYHDPKRLSELQSSHSDALKLDWMAEHLGAPPSPLRFLLGKLDSGAARADAMAACVSQLCSLLMEVQSSQEAQVQMFFVLLAALRSGSRSADTLWQEATAMLQATPRSTWHWLTSPDFTDPALPIQVAPDEVLQHIYERPKVDWRLVVLDIRSTGAALGLPVCVRLPLGDSVTSMDLSALPRDPAIHLCVVGDELQQALEVCRHLCAMGMCHVSLVDGGWMALEQLVTALGLELLPPSPAPNASNLEALPESEVPMGWMEALRAPSWALGWAEPLGRQWQDELMDV